MAKSGAFLSTSPILDYHLYFSLTQLLLYLSISLLHNWSSIYLFLYYTTAPPSIYWPLDPESSLVSDWQGRYFRIQIINIQQLYFLFFRPLQFRFLISIVYPDCYPTIQFLNYPIIQEGTYSRSVFDECVLWWGQIKTRKLAIYL